MDIWFQNQKVFEALSQKRFDLDQEHKMFDYAWKEGSDILSLYLPRSRPFWTLIAPQISYLHPAVKEAMIALGSQLNSLRYRWDPRHQTDDALRFRGQALTHYNKAMHSLSQAKPGELSIETLLTSSCLFTAMEMWPQQRMAPHVHISAALELCRDRVGQDSDSASFREVIRPFITPMGMAMAAYVDGFPSSASSLARKFDAEYAWNIPEIFNDIAEAHLHVDRLLERTVIFVSETYPLNMSGCKDLQQILYQVQRTAVNSAFQSPHKAQPQFQHDLRALQMHLNVISLMLKTYPVSDEMVFDAHMPTFERVLSECEQLLDAELNLSNRPSPIFNPTFGLLSPLFFIATRCRDPHLRTSALMALHRSSRRERLWNSCVAFIIAKFVRDAEMGTEVLSGNRSPTAPVDENDRIRLDSVEFDRDGQKIKVFYKHTPYDETAALETASLPWNPKIDDSYEAVTLSRKSVAAFGYTGTVLITPPISCQCNPPPPVFKIPTNMADYKAVLHTQEMQQDQTSGRDIG